MVYGIIGVVVFIVVVFFAKRSRRSPNSIEIFCTVADVPEEVKGVTIEVPHPKRSNVPNLFDVDGNPFYGEATNTELYNNERRGSSYMDRT
jgi:hypothetical protein